MSDYKPGSFDPRAYAEEASKGDPAFRDAYEGLADEFAALAEQHRSLTVSGKAGRTGAGTPGRP